MRARLPNLVFVLAFLAGLCRPVPAQACTALSVDTAQGRLLAKGFDWITGEGWLVLNERGRARSRLLPGGVPDDTWTSRFASLTLTTIGPGFPVSGMNEMGLAIEALVDLSATPVTTPEPGRLSGLEFVQYGLDTFASVAELADFAERSPFSQVAVALHLFACDPRGCAVIETRRGSPRVTRHLPVAALANRPYADDLAASRPSGLTAWLGLGRPARGSSAFRFSTVSRAIASAPPRDERAALELLEQVVIRRRTQWQIVWNLERRTVLLRQREAGLGTTALRLSDFDTRCSEAPRVMPLGRVHRGGLVDWSERDAAQSEQAVLNQAGGPTPLARRLAAGVARVTRSSACAPAR